jgi:glycosyltransferase involved in cell wall biosynthesis
MDRTTTRMSNEADRDHAPPDAPPGPLKGRLERADRTIITGWAMDETRPGVPVELEVLIDGEAAGTLSARVFRDDLLKGGIGDGCHSFWLYLPQGVSPLADHVLRIRRLSDGAELPGSPATIAREEMPAAAARQTIALALNAAAATAGPAELDALIGFLAGEAARLLLQREAPLPAPQTAMVARWTAAPAAAVEPDPRPRALFIDERVPDPDRDAGSNAAISHMRALQRLGYRVDFVAAHRLDQDDAASAALQAIGITCWQAPWIGSVEEVFSYLGEGLDLAYLHRFALMQRYAALVRRWCPTARLVYCVADLHYLRLARRLAVEAGLPAGGMLAEGALPEDLADAAAGLRTAELLAVLGADAVITHSAFEQALLRREVPEANVHLVPWEVPPRPTGVAFAERSGLAFIGSFGHPPNLDAAHFLVETVMPLVWAEDPTIACLLVGTDLPASLRAAAERAPADRVVVLGHVPHLSAVWDRVRLSVAPLRFGAGLKGKVLDSLAAGIPCVCSPMAAEGMNFPPDLSALVVDTPASLATVILRVHNDAPDNAGLAASGLAWVRRALSAAAIDAALAAAAGRPAPS